MSDPIHHHCGIALIRLKQPLAFYAEKYGTPLHGFNKLFLLMEKQHNRGQDGAGIGCVKLNMPLGQAYMARERELDDASLTRLFRRQLKQHDRLVRAGRIDHQRPETVKDHFDFGGEVLMGHLRYGTSGEVIESACHPYFRRSNWPTRNLMVCGNFNMTNLGELNAALIARGQHPIFDTDTQTVLEEIGFFLDEAHDAIYHEMKAAGLPGEEIPGVISERLDVPDILRQASRIWDGGYAIAGMVGNGDAFVMRDPRGIRPAFFFEDDEIIAFASERVPLLTVFNLEPDQVQELPPGHVGFVKNTGVLRVERFAREQTRTACSFERIYFSRGNDPDIYQERKALGAALAEPVLDAVGYDFGHAVFSFIPNTAEIAFHGLVQRSREIRRHRVRNALVSAHQAGRLTSDLIDDLVLCNWPRQEKMAHKDIKLRTFISQEAGRSKLVSHVYDITYGVIQPDDTLIVLDDSIVRGTTLKDSIIKILGRTNPRRIIIASTAPQIRYPDCYGIDMSELGKFIAFQAAIDLLRERGQDAYVQEVYRACQQELRKPASRQENCVKAIYTPFTEAELSARIAQMLYPQYAPHEVPWRGELVIVYQSIEALHQCCPHHTGDWYFTGNYPTPGGTAVCNNAFVNYVDGTAGRSYDVSPPRKARPKTKPTGQSPNPEQMQDRRSDLVASL